jgi:hypothetical protein
MPVSSQYADISTFGNKAAYAPVNNPLTYILSSPIDNMFMHGSNRINSDTLVAQSYIGEYCSTKFDGFCSALCDNNAKQYYPNLLHGSSTLTPCGEILNGWCSPSNLSKGDVCLINIARTKYLYEMRNGLKNRVPFDCTVAASPLVTVYSGEYMVPIYTLPKKGGSYNVDQDPVMNRLLLKANTALDVLMNIYSTMKNQNRLDELKDTKLGRFYNAFLHHLSKNPSKIRRVQDQNACSIHT